jgi:serine/threonine-protein kinase SRPK3
MSSSPRAADPLGHLPLRLGQTLKGGRYTVLRKLGSGTYSKTWLVSDAEKV